MKKIALFIFVFFITSVFAQVPQKIHYQGVARLNGAVMSNSTIAVKFQIHKNSPTGVLSYTEALSVSTNQYGLFTAEIGSAHPIAFSLIDWGSNTYYLEVLMDPTNSGSFTSIGTQQLLSVPYALYAKSAGTTVNFSAVPSDTMSIPSSSTTVLKFNTVNYSTPSTVFSGNTFTAPTAGIYHFDGSVFVTNPNTSLGYDLNLYLMKNNVIDKVAYKKAPSSGQTQIQMTISADIKLTVGETVNLSLKHLYSGSINTINGFGYNYFTGHKVD